MWEREGYKAVPSPRQPAPNDESYYRGGYITLEYGTIEGKDEVDAIQVSGKLSQQTGFTETVFASVEPRDSFYLLFSHSFPHVAQKHTLSKQGLR